MNESKSLEKRTKYTAGVGLMSLVGGAALLLAAAAIVVALPDIKRYIKISMM